MKEIKFSVRLTVLVTPEMSDKLRELSYRTKMSMGDTVRIAIHHLLKANKKLLKN